MARKRGRSGSVPPTKNKKGRLAPEQKIRSSTKEREYIEKFKDLISGAECYGFVTADSRLSMEEAEHIWAGIKEPKVHATGLTVVDHGTAMCIPAFQLAFIFGTRAVQALCEPPKRMLTLAEAREFLKFQDLSESAFARKRVMYGTMPDQAVRKYVEFFTKWVMLKTGYTYANPVQLTYARAVLRLELHPLAVWKVAVGKSLVRQVPWPSLTAYMVCFAVREYRTRVRPNVERLPVVEDPRTEAIADEESGDATMTAGDESAEEGSSETEGAKVEERGDPTTTAGDESAEEWSSETEGAKVEERGDPTTTAGDESAEEGSSETEGAKLEEGGDSTPPAGDESGSETEASSVRQDSDSSEELALPRGGGGWAVGERRVEETRSFTINPDMIVNSDIVDRVRARMKKAVPLPALTTADPDRDAGTSMVLYPPMASVPDNLDLSKVVTYEARVEFTKRPPPPPDARVQWLAELNASKMLARIVLNEKEVRENERSRELQAKYLEERSRRVVSDGMLKTTGEARDAAVADRDAALQEAEASRQESSQLKGAVEAQAAKVADLEERVESQVTAMREASEKAREEIGGMKELLESSEQRAARAEVECREIADARKQAEAKLEEAKESLRDVEERMVRLEEDLAAKLAESAAELREARLEGERWIKAQQEKLRAAASSELVHVTGDKVHVSYEAYQGWELGTQELRIDAAAAAKALESAVEEIERLKSMLGPTERIERTTIQTWEAFSEIVVPRGAAIETDEALGLSALRAILSRANLTGVIRTREWDAVWYSIPLRIRFMLPFFVWCGAIATTKPTILHFRLGGMANSRIAAIVLSELHRAEGGCEAYRDAMNVAEPEVSDLPRERQRAHSLLVQERLFGCLPTVFRSWAARDAVRDTAPYTLARFMSFLDAAGWNGAPFRPLLTSGWMPTSKWLRFVDLPINPGVAQDCMRYFYELGRDPASVACVGPLRRLDELPRGAPSQAPMSWDTTNFFHEYTPTDEVMRWMELCIQDDRVGGYFGACLLWRRVPPPPEFLRGYVGTDGSSGHLYLEEGWRAAYHSIWQHNPTVRMQLPGILSPDDESFVDAAAKWVDDVHAGVMPAETLQDPRIFKWYLCCRTLKAVLKDSPERHEVKIRSDGTIVSGWLTLWQLFCERGPSAVRMYNIMIEGQFLRGEDGALRGGCAPAPNLGYCTVRIPPGMDMEAAPEQAVDEYNSNGEVAGETPGRQILFGVGSVRPLPPGRQISFSLGRVRPVPQATALQLSSDVA